MPDLLKIGSTKRSTEERKRELSKATGVPLEFQIAYEIFCLDIQELENSIHKDLEAYRINHNREFFRYDLNDAIRIVRAKVEEIQLKFQYEVSGINELLDPYEAIEILSRLKDKFPEMIREEVKSVRMYQTRNRCYLEVTEIKQIAELLDQEITRTDLSFISGEKDPLDSICFMPSIPVSKNAIKFLKEFDAYSTLMCCDGVFTEEAIQDITNEYQKGLSMLV